MEVKRFSTPQIVAHFLASTSIFMLILTGLPITFYSDLKWVMDLLGGSQLTMLLHRFFAIILIFSVVYFGVYFLLERLTGKNGNSNLSFFLKSFTKLVRDMVKDVGWTLGLSKERASAGKYDWIMVADMVGIPILVLIEILTGIFMWFPFNFTSNPAVFFAVRAIHAGLAVFFVFFIFAHATILHFTPSNYPINMSIFTGRIPLKKAKLEHPEWVNYANKVDNGENDKNFSLFAIAATFIIIAITLAVGFVLDISGEEGLIGLRVPKNNVFATGVLNAAIVIVLLFAFANILGAIKGIKD